MHTLFFVTYCTSSLTLSARCSIMCFHHKTTPYPHSCGHKGELARSAALRSEADHSVFHTRADTEVDLPDLQLYEVARKPITVNHHQTTPYPHLCGHKGELARSATLRSEAEHSIVHTRADTEVNLQDLQLYHASECTDIRDH